MAGQSNGIDGPKKEISVGDILPIKRCEIIDTYYMVSFQNENYFVNSQGKVIAVVTGSGREGEQQTMESPQSIPEAIEHEWVQPTEWEVKDFGKTGTPDYDRAVEIMSSFLEAVWRLINRHYPNVAAKMEKALGITPALIQKYLDRRRGGLPGLKAYVIRELFSNTNIAERGMEILSFLTEIISMTESGNILYVGELNEEEQKKILINFLNFASQLGTTPEHKRIFALAYRYFIDPELAMAIEMENPGYYINHSYVKTMKAQREFLRKVYNRQNVDANYEQVMRISRDFIITHFLAYLKALLIMRINSVSKKEQRGRSEEEREMTLRDIISF